MNSNHLVSMSPECEVFSGHASLVVYTVYGWFQWFYILPLLAYNELVAKRFTETVTPETHPQLKGVGLK